MSRELAILEKLKSEYTQNNMEQVMSIIQVTGTTEYFNKI
jgi:hypothetical protein